jgi:hypothetical protein
MNKFILVSLAVLSLGMLSFSKKEKKEKPLENMVFAVTLVEENNPKPTKPIPEELKFKSGNFMTQMFEEKYMFEKAEYLFTVDSADAENVKIHFNCEMRNDKNEKLLWDADVEDDTIDGKILWMKKGKDKTDVVKKAYSFNGKIKMKK